MMKIAVILAFLFTNGLIAFAQKTDSSVNHTTKTRNIDGVMMSSSKDAFENLSASPEFSTLINAIKAAELTDTFKGTGPISVFAPTNKAFEKLVPGKLDTLLLPAHKAELIALISYHAVAGNITSKDIYRQIKAGNGQATFKTLAGSTLTASINANRNIVLTDENGGQSVISRLDIQQSNGVLFIITAMLIPKSQ